MNKLILPEFSHIPATLGEGFSEYFVQPDNFSAYVAKNTVDPNTRPITLEADGLIGMVGSCLAENEQTASGCTGVEDSTPLATATALLKAYQRDITPLQERILQIMNTGGLLAQIGVQVSRQKAITALRQANIRTIAAYALFQSEDTDKEAGIGVIIVPNQIAQDVPLKGRESIMDLERSAPEMVEAVTALVSSLSGASTDELNQRRQQILRNEDPEHYGLQLATLSLPSPQQVRQLLSMDPQIGDFFELTGKQKRTRLRQERRDAKEQTN